MQIGRIDVTTLRGIGDKSLGLAKELLGVISGNDRLQQEGEAQQERALKYAHHFFFRRMIPLRGVRARPGWPPFQIAVESIDELLKKADVQEEGATVFAYHV